MTEPEYEAAIARIEVLMDLCTDPGSWECIELQALVLQVEAYEDEHYPM